jgi:hypothetical protein
VPGADISMIATQTAMRIPAGGTIQLQCGDGFISTPVGLWNLSLTAVKVGALH